MISAYLYSTKRSGQAIVLNVVRSLVMNSLVITLVSTLFGDGLVWHTFGIFEVLVLVVAVTIKRMSERYGVAFQ